MVLGDADTFTGAEAVMAIARGSFRHKSEAQISESGYVIASLEAALWSFMRTDCFKDAVLTAVNLGDDADTTAAICGQLAGAFYGLSDIPASWLERLAWIERITALADDLGHRPPAGDVT